MTTQMTVNLPLEKARQHLLKYFERRDDIKVKRLEPYSVQVRTSGWKYPWMNIKIEMFEEENKTRLAFNFNFRTVYAVLATATVICIAILWSAALIRPENAGIAIGFILGALIFAPIAFASDISKAKRKFLDDIRKVFIC